MLLISFASDTQNWTPKENEIIKKVESGLSSWQKAVNEKNLTIWLNATNPTENWQCWWTDNGGISNINDTKRFFKLLTEEEVKFYWSGIKPLIVKVQKDVAFIWFYVSYVLEDIKGTTSSIEEKRLEVYQKIDKKWRWSAGMVTPSK